MKELVIRKREEKREKEKKTENKKEQKFDEIEKKQININCF